MNAVALGPFVLDAARLAAVIGLATFFVAVEVIDRLRRRRGRSDGLSQRAGLLVLVWLLAARLGHVAGNWPAFAEAPLDILQVWQGGFSAGWGFAAALVAGLWPGRSPVPAAPLVLAGALAVTAWGISAVTLHQPLSARLPAARLADLSGTDLSLGAGPGPMVLNLWATWCPPCRREMPMMMELAGEPGAPRFVFANQGEDAARVRRFLAAAGLPDTGVVLDPAQDLMRGFGALGLPATLFFDAEGRLVAAHTGEISRAELRRRIAALAGD